MSNIKPGSSKNSSSFSWSECSQKRKAMLDRLLRNEEVHLVDNSYQPLATDLEVASNERTSRGKRIGQLLKTATKSSVCKFETDLPNVATDEFASSEDTDLTTKTVKNVTQRQSSVSEKRQWSHSSSDNSSVIPSSTSLRNFQQHARLSKNISNHATGQCGAFDPSTAEKIYTRKPCQVANSAPSSSNQSSQCPFVGKQHLSNSIRCCGAVRQSSVKTVSSSSSVQESPGLRTSTGPVINKIPQMTVNGAMDVSNFSSRCQIEKLNAAVRKPPNRPILTAPVSSNISHCEQRPGIQVVHHSPSNFSNSFTHQSQTSHLPVNQPETSGNKLVDRVKPLELPVVVMPIKNSSNAHPPLKSDKHVFLVVPQTSANPVSSDSAGATLTSDITVSKQDTNKNSALPQHSLVNKPCSSHVSIQQLSNDKQVLGCSSNQNHSAIVLVIQTLLSNQSVSNVCSTQTLATKNSCNALGKRGTSTLNIMPNPSVDKPTTVLMPTKEQIAVQKPHSSHNQSTSSVITLTQRSNQCSSGYITDQVASRSGMSDKATKSLIINSDNNKRHAEPLDLSAPKRSAIVTVAQKAPVTNIETPRECKHQGSMGGLERLLPAGFCKENNGHGNKSLSVISAAVGCCPVVHPHLTSCMPKNLPEIMVDKVDNLPDTKCLDKNVLSGHNRNMNPFSRSVLAKHSTSGSALTKKRKYPTDSNSEKQQRSEHFVPNKILKNTFVKPQQRTNSNSSSEVTNRGVIGSSMFVGSSSVVQNTGQPPTNTDHNTSEQYANSCNKDQDLHKLSTLNNQQRSEHFVPNKILKNTSVKPQQRTNSNSSSEVTNRGVIGSSMFVGSSLVVQNTGQPPTNTDHNTSEQYENSCNKDQNLHKLSTLKEYQKFSTGNNTSLSKDQITISQVTVSVQKKDLTTAPIKTCTSSVVNGYNLTSDTSNEVDLASSSIDHPPIMISSASSLPCRSGVSVSRNMMFSESTSQCKLDKLSTKKCPLNSNRPLPFVRSGEVSLMSNDHALGTINVDGCAETTPIAITKEIVPDGKNDSDQCCKSQDADYVCNTVDAGTCATDHAQGKAGMSIPTGTKQLSLNSRLKKLGEKFRECIRRLNDVTDAKLIDSKEKCCQLAPMQHEVEHSALQGKSQNAKNKRSLHPVTLPEVIVINDCDDEEISMSSSCKQATSNISPRKELCQKRTAEITTPVVHNSLLDAGTVDRMKLSINMETVSLDNVAVKQEEITSEQEQSTFDFSLTKGPHQKETAEIATPFVVLPVDADAVTGHMKLSGNMETISLDNIAVKEEEITSEQEQSTFDFSLTKGPHQKETAEIATPFVLLPVDADAVTGHVKLSGNMETISLDNIAVKEEEITSEQEQSTFDFSLTKGPHQKETAEITTPFVLLPVDADAVTGHVKLSGNMETISLDNIAVKYEDNIAVKYEDKITSSSSWPEDNTRNCFSPYSVSAQTTSSYESDTELPASPTYDAFESLICICLDAADTHATSGVQMINDYCNTCSTPSIKLVDKVFMMLCETHSVVTMQSCCNFLQHLDHLHQTCHNLPLWNLIERSAKHLDCIDDENVHQKANGFIIELIARILQKDLKDCYNKLQSLAYRYLDPDRYSSRIKRIINWISNALHHNKSKIQLTFACNLSKLLEVAIKASKNSEVSGSFIATEFCSVYRELLTPEDKAKLILLVKPHTARAQFLSLILERYCDTSKVSLTLNQACFSPELSLEKIVYYYFSIRPLTTFQDEEDDVKIPPESVKSSSKSQKAYKEWVNVLLNLLESYCALRKNANSSLRSAEELSVAEMLSLVDQLQMNVLQECPPLRQDTVLLHYFSTMKLLTLHF